MTSVAEFLAAVGRVDLAKGAPEVCRTIAAEVSGDGPNRLRISVDPDAKGAFFRVQGARAHLGAADARFLFGFYRWLVEAKGGEPVSRFARRTVRPAFRWIRPVYDLYFTQSGRMVRDLDPEAYVREMARTGFTHLEVNGLAADEGMEEGVPGEVYPRFYTYCAALDQFTSSFLNRGVYPKAKLRANLDRLKRNADLAERFGLVPTLTCFEPRSVPEKLLAKYPELRGCRVDHPFRSFRPRYNLAVGHPVVRRHYRELMRNLLEAVPALGCLSVWSNDSGAGYEFTRSLYVGANGSAYLVREWSAANVFANAAADNATGFLRLLRDAAAEVNPEFRVTTRLEPFGPERARVLSALGDGLDVEVPTLLAEGWDAPYGHPRYEDSKIGPFTVFNNTFHPKEKPRIARLARRDCRTHAMLSHGPANNFEPLLGIPSPWLTHEKLTALAANGADHLAHLGGIAPPASVPYPVNEEVRRRFLFEPRVDVEGAVAAMALDWAGPDHAATLVLAWRETEEAIRGFMPNPLYFLWGVWYRIEIRPLVPDIEAIPERRRAYYERHILSTHHNPNRVDLARDVLFTLMTPPEAGKAATRIGRHALPPLSRAIARLEAVENPPHAVTDLRDRLVALRCWMTTRRSVAVWIADVHGHVSARSDATRDACRKRLANMAEREIANTRTFLAHLKKADTTLLALSAGDETTFLYGGNITAHLEKKIRLMTRYADHPPRIDPNITWRIR